MFFCHIAFLHTLSSAHAKWGIFILKNRQSFLTQITIILWCLYYLALCVTANLNQNVNFFFSFLHHPFWNGDNREKRAVSVRYSLSQNTVGIGKFNYNEALSLSLSLRFCFCVVSLMLLLCKNTLYFSIAKKSKSNNPKTLNGKPNTTQRNAMPLSNKAAQWNQRLQKKKKRAQSQFRDWHTK